MPSHNPADDATAEELLAGMDPAAKARAQDELAHLAPGPAEPFQIGTPHVHTQLDEDPISEVSPFQETRP